jgi:hypothetical protein
VPQQPAITGTATAPAAEFPYRHDDRAWLRHPVLTGLSARDWDELINGLAGPCHDQREANLHRQRGGPRRVAAGTGRHPALTLAERVLATVLHRRFGLPQIAIAELFGVTLMTANRAIRQIGPLLDQAGHVITPAAKRLYSVAELTAFAANAGVITTSKIKSAS